MKKLLSAGKFLMAGYRWCGSSPLPKNSVHLARTQSAFGGMLSMVAYGTLAHVATREARARFIASIHGSLGTASKMLPWCRRFVDRFFLFVPFLYFSLISILS